MASAGTEIARTGTPQSVAALLHNLEATLESGGSKHLVPIPTGFDAIDRVLGGGLRAGELVLIGGVPGVGKTVAALQWAREIARSGRKVIYACYEHDELALLTRLIATELGELPHSSYGEAFERVGDGLAAVASGAVRLETLLEDEALIRSAYEQVATYAGNLMLVRCSGARTGIPELEQMVLEEEDPVLFVDYLQKVAAPKAELSEAECVTIVTEGLKDLALARGIPIVCVAAAGLEGLATRRLRLHHLTGSAALAYESDAVVILNDKTSSVAKTHLVYDSVRAKTFADYTIFSIEKNRNGPALVDLQFRKDFVHFRFDPKGSIVEERLTDGRTFVE